MTTIDDLDWGPEPPERIETATPKRCLHPRRQRETIVQASDPERVGLVTCGRCGKVINEVQARRGRNNRKRGGSHELAIARRYGGDKVGPLGLPEDIRGVEYRTQVKTHQRSAPLEWRKSFAALEAGRDGRTPRLIVRFLPGPGLPADDYIILKGSDWLDRFGRDDEGEAA